MHWLLIVVIVLALLAASSVDFRWGIGLLGALVVAAVIFYFLSDGSTFGGRIAPIEAASIELGEPEAEPAYGGSYRLTTRVGNPSTDHQIDEMLLRIVTLDCPDQTTADAQCEIVSDLEHRTATRVPPEQSRDLTMTVTPAPFSIKAVERWKIEVNEVRTQ